YGVLGSKGVITVAASDRQKCNRCMDCFHVCPEPHVLRAPVLEELKKHGVKYIALRCAGFNNVDLDAAKELGLKVVRVPAY
ncbi:hypothetical protein MMT22_29945, partial [Escherichia coli]|nr:hypothetical protein [Escherichia coli]